MRNWHVRDVCGCLLLLLVTTEAVRKWAFVQELSSEVLSNKIVTTQDPAIHQVARRLLEPRIPSLCQGQQECEEGVGVTCMYGNVVACSCEYIAVCHPFIKSCSRFNATHTESCGF
ncbi:uncharacterized protein [Physcomitrium patens]|uniref:Uncharacterized protein n=1 Tax=Physcomitrium patens TaxID=3218 RepID=A0A2K1ISP1_PHYPA|nr:uncharacterized protein LOC112273843 [Physcomitrium patens]PNR32294.1 hypothetical protein PHYPA_026420 [Physcomitrium patens]|eukprot:XP_024358605.1 uncharacterized protein LOC112273843 [Physcomitrella patens]